MVLGLEFPPVSHLVNWPESRSRTRRSPSARSTLIVPARGDPDVRVLLRRPDASASSCRSGVQNVAEASLDFIRESVIMQTMGSHGPRVAAVPHHDVLLHLLHQHLRGHPGVPDARQRSHRGPAHPRGARCGSSTTSSASRPRASATTSKNSLVPPGVPKALLILVVPIEFVSTFLVRPFSLAIRLFANMLAGHFILVTFALLCADLFAASVDRGPAAVHLRPARRPDGFRGARRRLAGVHLHDPHRRVHRRFHVTRALATPSTTTQQRRKGVASNLWTVPRSPGGR